MKYGYHLAAALIAGFAASPASAGTILALVDGTSIARIDPATMQASGKVEISGADTLIGIDVRPADGMLYGVTETGVVVTIDPKTGAATRKSELTERLPAGTPATVDFNPAADKLRIMGGNGVNHRADVDSGKVVVDGGHKWTGDDPKAKSAPLIVAGAYTNSINGTKAETTALFTVDAATGVLALQAPPNDGVLSRIGELGVKDLSTAAFEIVAADGTNTGWLMAGSELHKVDLDSGKATSLGMAKGLSGTVTDIAWWP